MNFWEKRASIVVQARALLEKVKAENRNFTAEEQEQYNKMDADIDSLTKSIEAEQRLAKVETEKETREVKSDKVETNSLDPKTEYRKAFNHYLRTGDTRGLMETRVDLQIGTDSEGGYACPTDMANMIIETRDAESVVRSVSTVIPISGRIALPLETTTGTAAYGAEEAATAGTANVFGQLTLDPEKCTKLIKVSEELLADAAFDLEAYLARQFGRNFAVAEEAGFTTGTGTNEPLGFTVSTTLGMTTVAEDAITAEELFTLFYSVLPQYRRNAVWMFNDTTLAFIRKIKNTTTNEYIWQPSFQADAPDMLFGKRVLTNQALSALATSGFSLKVGAFGDFSSYYIGDRGGVSMQRLNELYAGTGQVGFRGYIRNDGGLTNTVAVKHLLSHDD
jgi:HK97 family phage major capsid protein